MSSRSADEQTHQEQIAMRDHKTRRGELLARFEHTCHRPGQWGVEGHQLLRHKYNQWRVKCSYDERRCDCKTETFMETLEVVAVCIDNH